MGHHRSLAIALLLLCTTGKLSAQSFNINQYGLTISQAAQHNYSKVMVNDTGEGGGLTNAKTFQAIWNGRVSQNDTSGNNMFSEYATALRQAVQARISGASCTGTFQGNWQCLGPDSLPVQHMGKVDAIWADDSNANYILAGTIGGLFKTTDGGKHWKCITDNAPVIGGFISITCITVNPLNKNTIYLGTMLDGVVGPRIEGYSGNGVGILRSLDGGNTWQQLLIHIDPYNYNDSIEGVQKIYITPDDTMRLYAFIDDSVYTKYTSDTAITWQNITPPVINTSNDPATTWAHMAFVPGHQDHFFISNGGDDLQQAAIWESQVPVPGPLDWVKITAGFTDTLFGPSPSYPHIIVHDKDFVVMSMSIPDSDTLYAIGMYLDNYYSGLWKYNLTGTPHTWIPINRGLLDSANPNKSHFELIVSPAATDSNSGNKIIYYGNSTPYMSIDGGTSFYQIGLYAETTHADIRSMYLQKATDSYHGKNDILFLATDGGVSKKYAGVDPADSLEYTTKDISGIGLTCGDFWGIATSEHGGLVIGGEQHDGVMGYEPKANPPWAYIGYGDASSAIFDNNGTTAYPLTYQQPNVTYPNSSTGRVMDYIGGWYQFPSNDTSNINLPLFIDSANNQYAGTRYFRKLVSGVWTNYGGSHGISYDGINIRAIAGSHYQSDFVGYVLKEQDSSSQELYYRPSSSVNFALVNTIPPGTPGYPMLSIATDPANTDRVWVGLGGVNYATDLNINRVLYSPDGGSSWYDVSYGLPPRIPATNLVYQEGANVLFCATDAGVYRCDMSTFSTSTTPYHNVHWDCFNQGASGSPDFPNAIVTDLKINYCQGKLYASTYGRAIWVSDLANPYDIVQGGDTIATGTTNWTTDKYITGAIVIPSGAELDMTNITVHMPRNGTIIVEPGGKLVVNHSKITNECDGCMWFGIEAIGQSNLPQSPTTNQGWVQITNGSVIENARYAVSNCDMWNSYANPGGIIQVSGNSNFINNHVSGSFYGYHNRDASGALHDNTSFFTNCTFLLDNGYKGDSWSYPFWYHCFISDVEGIAFNGVQFLNRDTTAAEHGLGDGIRSYNGGGFTVSPFCASGSYTGSCLSGPWIRSRFCGLLNGVTVQGLFSADIPVSIDMADFDSCGVGVNVAGANNTSTTRCNFKVGNGSSVFDVMTAPNCGQNIGILMQNAYNFRMEGNNFTGCPITTSYWHNYGTVVANTATSTAATQTKVYLNSFDSLTEGVYALGRNKYSTGSASFQSGLYILCNTFDKNLTDIKVDSDNTGGPQGIASVQAGYSSTGYTPAGNTFSNTTYNRLVNNANPIQYYYDSSDASAESPGTVAHVANEAIFITKSCPPTLNTGGTGLPVRIDLGTLATYMEAINTNKTVYSDSLKVYDSSIDLGGLTAYIIDLIDNASDSATLNQLYYAGISLSPYLSEAVVQEMFNVGMWSDSQVFSILVLNPDNLCNADFLASMVSYYAALDTMNDFTTDYADSLLNASHYITPRTTLETAIGTTMMAMSDEANVIMMSVRTSIDTAVSVTDTTGAGICTDSNSVYYMRDSNSYYFGFVNNRLDIWIQNLQGLWPQYDRVGYYNYLGQHDVADSIFKGINDNDKSGDTTYKRVWKTLLHAENFGRNALLLGIVEIADLDTTSVPLFTPFIGEQLLRNITSNITSVSSGSSIPPYVGPCPGPFSSSRMGHTTQPKPTKKSVIKSVDAVKNKTGDHFVVYPNPTSGVVTFAYNVAQAGGDIRIVVTNLLGETVAELHTGNNTGKSYWDASKQPAGVYFYQACGDKGIICNGKIVVAR